VEFLADYAGFLAKTFTVVVAIVIVLVVIAALRGRGRRGGSGHLEVHKLNDFYKELRERLQHSVLEKARLKALRKSEAKSLKEAKRRRAARRTASMCSTSMVTSRPRPPSNCAMKSPRC
jgi:inner membrane peptidase. Serine peptidase. MEROPS family S49